MNSKDEQPNTDNTVEPIVDSPTDIAMDVELPTDSDDVQPIANCVANVASSTDIAIECSDCNDPLLSAMHKLETIASQNGFTIHDVPADGDCMFSAIVYKWKNHFYKMKGDVGMSGHEKERKQEDAYTKIQTHS